MNEQQHQQPQWPMSTERFNELLNGPLSHPLVPFAITRLALALRAVIDATGPAGVKALEDHCLGRELQDAMSGM